MIRMEAEHISDTGFPLDVFPQAVQSVILDMDRYENYKTEFIATAMLSAVSAALGGTYRIRIKGEWQSNAALYIILVGRPGLGKTPPLEAAYRPIRKHDYALRHRRWRRHTAPYGSTTTPCSRRMSRNWRHGRPPGRAAGSLYCGAPSCPTSLRNRSC